MKRINKLLPVFISIVMIGLSGCGKDEIPRSDEKEILSFKINGTEGDISYGSQIEFTFPVGTDVSNLIPQITVSDKAKVIPASGVAQDFSGDNIVYQVTAEDGSTKDYTVIVTVKRITFRVGDLYPDSENPIGVVFWLDGPNMEHGKIISLDEAKGIAWSTEKVVTGCYSDDGKENTDKIKNSMDLNKYPAFKWCIDKGEGWYLPSYEELKKLNDTFVRSYVNNKLKELGLTELWVDINNFYWTSNEWELEPFASYAATGVSKDGFINTEKTKQTDTGFFDMPFVRAIRTF